MQEHEYRTMGEVETRHWWYRALRDMVVRDLKPLMTPGAGFNMLDAGCGTGGMLERLQAAFPQASLHGIDFSATAASWTKSRGFLQVTQASINDLPFPPASMDAVISLDVLYHAAVDQNRALAECHRVLKHGGTLILNLPAYDALRGRHDVAVAGVRRYRPGQLRELLVHAGFDVITRHAWNSWLFLPLLLRRQLSRRHAESPTGPTKGDLAPPSPWINALLAPVCALDTRMSRLLRNPLGTSLYVIARRP